MNAPLAHHPKRGPAPGTQPCAASLRNLHLRGSAYWTGRIPDPVRAHPLVRQFIALMNLRRVWFTHVAQAVGCSPNTPSEWRYNRTPRIDLFGEACAALGFELAIVARRAPHEQANDFILGVLS